MKLLCDTNVLLDVALHREPFFTASMLALSACENESVYGMVADISLSDLYYIVKRAFHDSATAYEAVEATLEILHAVSPSSEEIAAAIAKRHREFEDGLLAGIAEREECDYLITRNVKDFEGYSFTAITPSDFIKLSL